MPELLQIKNAEQIVDNPPKNGKNPYNLLYSNDVSTWRSWDPIFVFRQVSYSSIMAEPEWKLLGCFGRMGWWPYRNFIGEKNMKCAHLILVYWKGIATKVLKDGPCPQLWPRHQCFLFNDWNITVSMTLSDYHFFCCLLSMWSSLQNCISKQ